jgi:hypothetical protein
MSDRPAIQKSLNAFHSGLSLKEFCFETVILIVELVDFLLRLFFIL